MDVAIIVETVNVVAEEGVVVEVTVVDPIMPMAPHHPPPLRLRPRLPKNASLCTSVLVQVLPNDNRQHVPWTRKWHFVYCLFLNSPTSDSSLFPRLFELLFLVIVVLLPPHPFSPACSWQVLLSDPFKYLCHPTHPRHYLPTSAHLNLYRAFCCVVSFFFISTLLICNFFCDLFGSLQ